MYPKHPGMSDWKRILPTNPILDHQLDPEGSLYHEISGGLGDYSGTMMFQNKS